jgi:hypothetical protein
LLLIRLLVGGELPFAAFDSGFQLAVGGGCGGWRVVRAGDASGGGMKRQVHAAHQDFGVFAHKQLDKLLVASSELAA